MTASITLGWLIALVVLLFARHLLPADVRWWVWTCVSGVAMGLFGLWYVPFLKRRRARIAVGTLLGLVLVAMITLAHRVPATAFMNPASSSV